MPNKIFWLIKSTSASPSMRQSPREHWRYWPECLTTASVENPQIRVNPKSIVSHISAEFNLVNPSWIRTSCEIHFQDWGRSNLILFQVMVSREETSLLDKITDSVSSFLPLLAVFSVSLPVFLPSCQLQSLLQFCWPTYFDYSHVGGFLCSIFQVADSLLVLPVSLFLLHVASFTCYLINPVTERSFLLP